MKHKLLLFGASLMVSVSLSAQNFTANRQKLVPEFTDWAMEEYFYMWNVGSQGFYTNHQGARVDPYWATRAIACDTIGQQVMFSRTNPGGNDESWDSDGVLDNTCLLTSYVNAATFQQFYCTFAEGWNSIWTDNNDQQYRYFNVVPSTGKYIKIERNMMLDNGGAVSEGKYLGILASDPDKTVKLHDTEEYIDDDEQPYYNIDPSAEFYEDWVMVTPEAYEAWVDAGGKVAGKIFAAAASLKSALEKAYDENPGITTLTEPLAVYNNEASTVEELQAAEASISGLIIEWIKETGGGTPEKPLDFTASIVNSTFDTVGDFTGWSSNTVDFTKEFGAGGTTAPCAEVWRGSFDVYQDLNGLPGGVYILSVNAYCRYNDSHVDDYNDWKAGNPTRTKLYMNSETAGRFSKSVKHISEGGSLDYSIAGADNTVDAEIDGINYTLYTPNSMYEANEYFHEKDASDNPTNRFYTELFGAVEDGETLRIGVTNPVTSDWSLFDDFQIKFIGDSEDSYKYWGNKVAEDNNVSFDGCFYGAPEKAIYDNAISALKAASNKTEIIAAISAFETAEDTVAVSKQNYLSYLNKCDEILSWLETTSIGGTKVDMLADYLQADAGEVDEEYPNGVLRTIIPTYEDGQGAGILSAEEIAAEIVYLENLQSDAIREGLEPGTELNELIVNPGFEIAGGKGWSLDTSQGGTSSLTNWHGGNATNYCAEAYQQLFDVYQIIENVPNGLYKVSVQAFYRTGTNADAYAAYQEDPEMTGPAKVYTYVYFNEFSQPVKNSMEILYTEDLAGNCVNVGTDDEGNALYCLNGMTSASTAFSKENESENFTQNVYGLVTDGVIRMGIRNLENNGSYTWSLWDNFKLTYMGKDEEALKEVIENYVLKAQELSDYGVPETQAVSDAIDNATASGQNGDSLYKNLIALVEAYNAAVESQKLYEEVAQVMGDLVDALEEYTDASQEAQDAAYNVYENYSEGVDLKTYPIETLKTIISEAKDAIAKLKIPDGTSASDDNPVDFTRAIVNPSYDEANSDGWEGSVPNHSGYNRTDMVEYWHASFDHHQTLVGLPAGTYELAVNCYNRVEDNHQADLNYFEAGRKSEVQTAFVYAVVGDQTFAEPFRMISEPKRTEWTLGGTYNSATSTLAPETYYAPNNMTAAGAAFEETDPDTDEPLGDVENYVVRVVFTLDEAGDVTIGCKNDVTNSWAIWDNWTLTYFGTDSQKTPSGDATGVLDIQSSASVVSTEVFTVGGARINAPQRGVNIIKTKLSDGTVKIQKVIVK